MLPPTRFARLACALALAWLLCPPAASAQSGPVFELLSRISALRIQNGLAPLALNDLLGAAAQRHSQDMANTGRVDHTGSDGSTAEQRIAAAGYTPYVSWGENIYGGGIAGVDDAWSFWTTSPVHRGNLLSERYREIGIGVAGSANGTYYTLNFGARSGVLPFFVDQGSTLTDPNLSLTLSNEEAAPSGSGGAMGQAVEVRAGEGVDLSAVAWQAWRRSLPFTLANVAGEHRITVEYRDAAGNVASYFRLVTLTGAAVEATATPSAEPTLTPTPPPADTPTAPPTDTPAPTATPSAPPSLTPTPSPSPTLPSTPTSPPTVTPVDSGTTIATASRTSTVLRAVSPTQIADGNDDRSPLEAFVARGWSGAPEDLIGLMIGLQLAALVLGAVFLARRSTRS